MRMANVDKFNPVITNNDFRINITFKLVNHKNRHHFVKTR